MPVCLLGQLESEYADTRKDILYQIFCAFSILHSKHIQCDDSVRNCVFKRTPDLCSAIPKRWYLGGGGRHSYSVAVALSFIKACQLQKFYCEALSIILPIICCADAMTETELQRRPSSWWRCGRSETSMLHNWVTYPLQHHHHTLRPNWWNNLSLS